MTRAGRQVHPLNLFVEAAATQAGAALSTFTLLNVVKFSLGKVQLPGRRIIKTVPDRYGTLILAQCLI